MLRRDFLKLVSSAALPLADQTANSAANRTVTVLTSFPEAMVTRIEAAFSAMHPDIELQVLWRFGKDAFNYLHGADAAAVDVYWAPAMYNFYTLAAENLFRPIKVDAQALPGKISRQQQSDPASRYVAVETAAYVLVTNDTYLQQHALVVPQHFEDLADPAYAGHIALPVPSRIGFAPPIYEHWLQQYGWQPGFELMSRIAANAELLGSGGTSIVDKVGSGRAGVGLSMDFFAHNAGAQGLAMSIHYPADTLFSPAHLGILAHSQHLREAQTFVDFMLSDAGQKILLEPNIGRLPMRSSVYRSTGHATFNPYSMAKVTVPHDIGLGLQRQPVVSALFDAAFTNPHAQLKTLWQAIYAAEHAGVATAKMQRIRTLMTQTPVDTDQERLPSLAKLLSLPSDTRSAERDQLLRDWDAFYAKNYAAATEQLQQVNA